MAPNRKATARTALLAAAAVALWRAASAGPPRKSAPDAAGKRKAGLAAWSQVSSVLTSPRCLNCHTAANFPEQGDDRHRHLFNVVRGPDDDGVPGLRCASCHQAANADSTGVPGAPGWRLAPLSMAWQTAGGEALPSSAICRGLLERSRRGGLGGPGLLKHHEDEPLVRWAFAPGLRRDGTPRSLPPLTREELVAATRRWIEAGMPCP